MRYIWRNMLTLQFHDILPGSSIHKVYTDSDETYADLFKRVDALKQNAVKRLMKDAKGDVILTNTLSSLRSDLVWFDAPAGVCALRTLDGREFAAQKVEDRYVAYVEDLKPMSATPMFFVYGNEGAPRVKLDEKGFETAALKGEFDSDMFISSLVDKDADRQLVKPGQKLNSLVYYENRPHNYDAWDINIYYREKSWQVEKPVEVKVISVGPVAGVIRVKWLTGDSAITQDYIIPADIKRVDFSSDIDWQEPHGLLKAHFPVDGDIDLYAADLAGIHFTASAQISSYVRVRADAGPGEIRTVRLERAEGTVIYGKALKED